MGLYLTLKVITIVECSERPCRVIQGNREWVTIIKCISSKGKSIPPVVILKAKEHQAAWYQEPKLLKTANKNWRLTTSNNGWTTDKIGLCWLKDIFEPYFKSYSTGAKQMLILDGHSSY